MARCIVCNDLCKRHESHHELTFDFTLEEIAYSARSNHCEPCLVIHEGLQQAQRANWSAFAPILIPTVKQVFARCHGEHGGYAETLHLVVVFVDEIPALRLEFYVLQNFAWKAILPRTTISQNPLADEAVAWIKDHIDLCKQTHVSCNTRRHRSLPKRLLSLKKDASGHIKVRLFEVGLTFSDEYATLSHCWGEEPSLITTEDTLRSYKKRILWYLIPQTFQDAIILTLRLGIGFIWIDSLCIVQDDHKDWEIESSKMAGIYQDAVLSLAATTSTGSSQGTYSRGPRMAKEIEIKLPDGLQGYRIGIRERVQHWNKTTANDANRFPLLSRGWVLQERLLSPRILHICDAELVWECRELSTCECGGLNQEKSPGAVFYNVTKRFEETKAQAARLTVADLPSLWGRVRSRSSSPMSRRRQPDSSRSTTTPAFPAHARISSTTSLATFRSSSETLRPAAAPVEDIPEFVLHYHRLVEQYSALQLTRPTDRLTAFSGLTERMQHFRNEYIAGLWSDSLCFDLMWRIDKHTLWDSRATRLKEYAGPSWSWVSATAPVQYWTDTVNYKDTVQHFVSGLGDRFTETPRAASMPLLLNRAKIKHDITILGKHSFGAVDSAILTLEASATTATLHIIHYYVRLAATPFLTADSQKVDFALTMDHLFNDDGSNAQIPFFADYFLNVIGKGQMHEGDEVALLLVHPDVALVLRHAQEHPEISGEQAWERIGIARLSDSLYAGCDWMLNSEVKTFGII